MAANATTNQGAIEPEDAILSEKESGVSGLLTIEDDTPAEHGELLRESEAAEAVESLNKEYEQTKVCDSLSAESIHQQQAEDEESVMAKLPSSVGGLGTIDLVPVEPDSGSDLDSNEM